MFQRYSAVPVTLVLFISTTAVSSQAQSGRGRQLRIQGTLRSESVAPKAANALVDQKADPGFSDSPLVLSRRTKGLIYNDAAPNQKKDDGEYHMTRADKRAGWILLGFFVLQAAIIISQDSITLPFSDNFRPESRLDGYFRPHRHSLEQFPDFLIFQRHAAPGPIAARAVTVNVDVAAEPRVLRRRRLSFDGPHDRIVLAA